MILSKLLLIYAVTATKPNQAEVYFIRDITSQTVKIGKTTIGRAPARLKALQTGNPNVLTLYKTISAQTHKEAFVLEKNLHQKFSSSHYRGEWFKDTVIKELK